jgi:DNA-binding winged helix-turn-helix (wHTH) protein
MRPRAGSPKSGVSFSKENRKVSERAAKPGPVGGAMQQATVLWCEDLRIDLRDERVWRGGQALPLTPKAFAVLCHLVAQPGQLVTKAALLEAVWPDTAVGDAVLTVAIRELRRALADDPRAPRFIQTVHRRGYRFLATVRSSPPAGVGSEASNRTGRPDPSLDITVDDAERARDGPPSRALVGRETELHQLHACLRRALDGECQVVFVIGEPGIGKTALVGAFVEQVARSTEAWIGEGQCIEHYGAGEAYLPVFGVLHQLCRRPHGFRLQEILARYAPSWLAQMPGLLDAPTLDALALRTQGATRERMLRELADALEAMTAEHPLVVVLEDLHWSDYASVELLSFLARCRPAARLLVIATYRPADAVAREHPVASVTDDLASHGLCRELPLERLTEVCVRRYVAGVLAEHRTPDGLASHLHQRTGGNPLFMVNVIQDWMAQGVLVEVDGHWELGRALEDAALVVPPSIRQLIERQLARLGASDQRLLEAASVAGGILCRARRR